MPRWVLCGERWQCLTVVGGEGVEGERTRYESRQVFGGLFAWWMRWVMREKLDGCFEAMGEALKERAEA